MAIRYTTTKTSIENVKLVVYGRSGTGKTRLIETAPEPVIISSEAKCLSIADSGIPVLEIDGVDLEFTDEAIHEVARLAVKKETGARGLKGILEKIMLDIMYEIPSLDDVKKCIVTKEAVLLESQPELVYKDVDSKKSS